MHSNLSFLSSLIRLREETTCRHISNVLCTLSGGLLKYQVEFLHISRARLNTKEILEEGYEGSLNSVWNYSYFPAVLKRKRKKIIFCVQSTRLVNTIDSNLSHINTIAYGHQLHASYMMIKSSQKLKSKEVKKEANWMTQKVINSYELRVTVLPAKIYIHWHTQR